MREIPKKNYGLLLMMAIVVVIVVFILMNMYNANKKEEYNSSVKEVINVILIDDVENYLQENLDAVLYINDSTKTDYKLENKIKKIITDNNIQQYFVYIEKDKELTKKYKLNDVTPILIAYKDGKVAEIFDAGNYSEVEIEAFLIRNGVIEHD